MMRPRTDRRAFTLVEVIAVLVVLAILATVSVVAYKTVVTRSADKSVELTVTSVVREAQALAALRSSGTYTAADYLDAAKDLPTPTAGTTAAAGWPVKTEAGQYVGTYGELHMRLDGDSRAAGIAAMSTTGNCILARAGVTGAPIVSNVGQVGASCAATNALGLEPGGASDVVWTDPNRTGPPSTPRGLKAVPTADGFTASWVRNSEPDVVAYEITIDNARTQLVASNKVTLTDNPGLHDITVKAVDVATLKSAPTAPAAVTVPPRAPSSIDAALTGTTVTLTWQPSATATSYELTRTYAGTTTSTLIATIPAPTTTYTDTVAPGQTFTYAVSAVNAGGKSAPTSTQPSTAAPAAPTGVKTTATNRDVKVEWAAAPGATSYEVYRDGASTPVWAGTALTMTDTGLPLGSTHTYVVAALNSGGANRAPAVSATVIPGTTTGLATAVSGTTVTLTWTATPGSNDYRVYVNGNYVKQVTGTATTVQQGLGTVASYQVSAFNAAGEGGRSNSASATTAPATPGTPWMTAHDQVNGWVTVNWPASATPDVTYTVVRYNTCSGYSEVWSGAGTSVRLGGHLVRCGYAYHVYATKNGVSSGWSGGSEGWWPQYQAVLNINAWGDPAITVSPTLGSSVVRVYWDSTYQDNNPYVWEDRKMTQYGGGTTYMASDGSQASARYDQMKVLNTARYCFLVRTYLDGNWNSYYDATLCT